MRFLTAGESHGKGLVVVLEGIPAGLTIDLDFINQELRKRQRFFGRGGRMKIERDEVKFLSGVRGGETIGSPLSFVIENRDWVNWEKVMHPFLPSKVPPVTRPRPGHADLAGVMKYLRDDCRDILERASARETAARTAVGAICKLFLKEFGMEVWGWVEEIGGVRIEWKGMDRRRIKERIRESELLTPDPAKEEEMKERIEEAREQRDTLGGTFIILAEGIPPGLGNHIQWDLRLDGLIAQGIMSIPGIKGVEIGEGFSFSSLTGSSAMDEIVYEKGRLKRLTNHMGGIEGGISNGEDILIRAVMKPIPTLKKPLRTVDFSSHTVEEAWVERGDVTAVPSACLVGEAMVSFILAREIKKKFGGDSMEEIRENFRNYMEKLQRYHG